MFRLEILRWWNEQFGLGSTDWLLAGLCFLFLLTCACLVGLLIWDCRYPKTDQGE